jgi:protein-tyrosine phosphatase
MTIDFEKKEVKRKNSKLDLIEFEVSSLVDSFNRIAYNKNVVLVHCAMGVSRSASCVIMYLMKKFRI